MKTSSLLRESSGTMPNDGDFTLSGKRIWVAGHRGMAGSALVRRLQREDCEVLTVGREQLDLSSQTDTYAWMAAQRPEAIVLAAAKVGGILANDSYAAEFLFDNLVIQTNVFGAARSVGVEKLLFLGSSCIYPKFAPQPIPEEALLTGPLESTNEWYAIAKIAGIKMAQAFRRQYGDNYISAMPTNLYGPNDNFDLSSSHVLPALIHKAHLAKVSNSSEITIWGSGSPRREFLHVDDCADALVLLLKTYNGEQHVNVGSGEDITILELTKLVCEIVGFTGEIFFDRSKPDGTPRKLMSADKLKAQGWSPKIPLSQGIEDTYQWFLNHVWKH